MMQLNQFCPQRAFKRLRSSIPPQPPLPKLFPQPPGESQTVPLNPLGLTNFNQSRVATWTWSADAFCRTIR